MKSKRLTLLLAGLIPVFLVALIGLSSPVVLISAEGGYSTGGGGGGGGGVPGGYASFAGNMNASGVILNNTSVSYPGGGCTLTINKGTTALDKYGIGLYSILVTKVNTPPAPPPANAAIVALTYEFTPSGATFSPPITLTLSYQPSDIPQGKSPNDLVIAYYDGSKWVNLTGPFNIDTTNHTISAPVSHFTSFAILAFPPAPTPVVTPTPTVTPTTPPVVTTTPPPTVPPTKIPTIAPTTAATTAPPVTPKPGKGISMWLVIGIIVAVIIIGIIAWLVMKRQKA